MRPILGRYLLAVQESKHEIRAPSETYGGFKQWGALVENAAGSCRRKRSQAFLVSLRWAAVDTHFQKVH